MTTASLALFDKPRRKRRTTRGTTLRILPIRNSAQVHGIQLVPLFDAAQIPARQYSHQDKCWLIPRQYIEQLVTYAEAFEGRVVTVEAVER